MIYKFTAFILLITSCKIFNNVSERKFGGIEDSLRNTIPNFNNVEFLTKHVHKKKWKIVYGFGCDISACSDSRIPYKDKKLLTYKEQLEHWKIAHHVENKISQALDIWLAPLRELGLSREIITEESFEFVELTPEPDDLSTSSLTYTPDQLEYKNFIYTPDHLKNSGLLGKVDLMVIIGSMTNYACPERTLELFSTPLSVPPFIYVSHDEGVTYAAASRKWKYSLLHELGHAFGLVDTYHNTSKGTIGQSAAVMNTELENYQDTHTLAPDDVKGMQWLYYFYHDQQKLRGNECFFDDYEVTKNNEGETFCRPIYPVIHEIKQAYLYEHHDNMNEAKGFMANAIKISNDLNNKKDKEGRTALHYAVMHEGKSIEMRTEWRQTIKNLLDAGFDKKIKDQAGNTACDYLQCQDSEDEIAIEVKCSDLRKLLCE